MTELNEDGLEPGKPVTFEQIVAANKRRATLERERREAEAMAFRRSNAADSKELEKAEETGPDKEPGSPEGTDAGDQEQAEGTDAGEPEEGSEPDSAA